MDAQDLTTMDFQDYEEINMVNAGQILDALQEQTTRMIDACQKAVCQVSVLVNYFVFIEFELT
jgi:hypothetical protein